MTTPTKDPITAQKGARKPVKMGPRCRVKPRGVAGKKYPVYCVKSTQGIGISCTGCSINAPVIAGTAT